MALVSDTTRPGMANVDDRSKRSEGKLITGSGTLSSLIALTTNRNTEATAHNANLLLQLRIMNQHLALMNGAELREKDLN